MSQTGITVWLLTLSGAAAAGMLVLHAFAKAKHITERMLSCYEDLLRRAREMLQEEEKAAAPPPPR